MDLKTKAKEFILKYGINSSNVLSLKTLTEIAVSEHFKVYRPKGSSDKVIAALGLEEYFLSHPAFSYSGDKIHYIIVHASISDGTAAAMALHELAHIFLGHFKKSEIPAASDEAEADMFVSCVLQEVYGQKHKVNPLSVIIAVIGVLAFSMSLHIADSYQSLAEPANSYSVAAQEDVPDIVYISRTGTKYHKADCYHIRNADVVEISVEEAQAAGYEPCKDCF